jgi:hypothetical protein
MNKLLYALRTTYKGARALHGDDIRKAPRIFLQSFYLGLAASIAVVLTLGIVMLLFWFSKFYFELLSAWLLVDSTGMFFYVDMLYVGFMAFVASVFTIIAPFAAWNWLMKCFRKGKDLTEKHS